MAVAARPPIAPLLIAWAGRYGRHDLPWQKPATPYRVWISEIMLQQTQVGTVIPYFERFMARFPRLVLLDKTGLEEILVLWSGLGYYARARYLHAVARLCLEAYHGLLPATLDELIRLPGIGRSTAGAILALGHGLRAPILDGNAKRVLARYHAVTGRPDNTRIQRKLWSLAERETPREQVAAYTQAIMDFGAALCTRAKPTCSVCPLAQNCAARVVGTPEHYPGKPLPKVRPCRERWFAWIERDGAVLFEQRPPTGIWGGLLCLPEIPLQMDPREWCNTRFSSAGGEPEELPGFQHEFTHFRLRARIASCNDLAAKIGGHMSGRWLGAENADSAALPTPIRRYLKTRLAGRRLRNI